MPLIGSFTKQPTEILPVDVRYSAVLGNRVAQSIVPAIAVPAGMTLESDEVSGSTLQMYVSGGTDGQTYRWVVTTDIMISGRLTRVEDEFDVLVEEVPNAAP